MSKEAVPDIQVIQQPDWISDDDIADVLHDAHKTTLSDGMHYTVLEQNGEEIRKRLGKDGVFFVALLDGKELIGVSGLSFYEKSKAWYTQGKPYAEIKLEGIRNAYKGMGISGMLHKAVNEYAFRRVDLMMSHTAERNKIVLHICQKKGWKRVDFNSWKGTDYYSVIMAKWKDKCPFSDSYCAMRYNCKKWAVKLLKTKNGKYRLKF